MSGKSTPPDFKALLAGAKLPEKTVPVCLRGDLAAEFETAERDLKERQRVENDSLDTGVGALVDRIESLRAQMQASTYPFRLRALPKPTWRKLIAEHPPRRDGDEIQAEDRFTGVNMETFMDALIRASVIDPDLSDGDWLRLDETLTDRQFGDLTDAAWFLNRGEIDVPFSRDASRLSRDSAAE